MQCVDRVENITRSNAKKVHVVQDGEEEDFVFRGDLNELIGQLGQGAVTDLLVEDPPLDEIFLHYYEKDGEAK